MKENKLLREQKLVKFTLYDKPRKKPIEWVNEQELYKGYRFRKRRITFNEEGKQIVHAPYIPAKESTNHEFSLQYPEWKEVVNCYFDCMVDELIKGNKYELPKGLGTIYLIKEKRNGRRGDRLFRNSHTMGYVPRIIWRRFKDATFRHRMWYMFNISRQKQWSRVSKALFANPSLIFKYPDN